MGKEIEEEVYSLSDEDKELGFQTLCTIFSAQRESAINARREQGIDEIWESCEEAYAGIDDANRGDKGTPKWNVPTSLNAPLTKGVVKSNVTKSSVYVPLSRRYADHASAKLSEIILPMNDKAFGLDPTPLPDLIIDDEQIEHLKDEFTGEMVMRDPKPEEMEEANKAAQATGGKPQIPKTNKDLQDEEIAKAEKAASKAESRIYDWMTESKYHAEARKVIKDGARIGTGILKAPYPEYYRTKVITKTENGISMQIENKVQPAVKWINPWNFYPADGCGENIHDGDCTWERDMISPKKLSELKNQGYIKSAIDKVLAEGANKCLVEENKDKTELKPKLFEIWYGYSSLKKEDLECVEVDGIEHVKKDFVDVIVTMVNDTIIKITLNPLDSGNFPYRVFTWSRRADMWVGLGVVENISVPQRMDTAATRSMLNNAGLSSGMQFIMDRLAITPADNSYDIVPNKVWYANSENGAVDVRTAFLAVQIPSVFNEMMGVVQYAERMAEEVSQIPLISQGQQNGNSPETFGQAQLQNTNALTWLRSVGYQYDDQITAPMIDDFYEWLLLDVDVPIEEKGDFRISASGSVAMVERAIQEQTIMGLLNASANPAFEINPKELFSMYLKSKHIDPSQVQYTKAEMEAKAREQQPPPPPPQIQAAQIRAEADAQKTQVTLQAKAQEAQAEMALQRELAQLEANTSMHKVQLDTDRDTAYVNAQAEKNRNDSEYKMQELQLRVQLAQLDYANKKDITLEQVRADLAKESMKLRTQKELSAAAMANGKSIKPVATPPTEPEGRAQNGRAYEQ